MKLLNKQCTKRNKFKKIFIKSALPLAMLIIPVQAFSEAPVVNALSLPYGKNITQQCSVEVMNATIAYAKDKKWAVTIAISDTAGQVVMLNRLDNAHRASTDFALEKAASAALTKRSTKIFSDALAAGRTAILGFTDLHVHVAEGGEVLLNDKQIIGSIGVAGVTQQQDRELAIVGVEAAKKCK